MRTLLAYAPAAEHTRPGHPENQGRVAAIIGLLDREGVLPDLVPVESEAASIEQLARVHTVGMIEQVRLACQQGGGYLDADTYATTASYNAARLAAGSACMAIDRILVEPDTNGLAIVRPPGHHAEKDRVGGFCLFNNVATAARHGQVVHGAQRVLIVDFDVHHGNGTQDIFYDDPSVLFISLHLYSPFFYPGTGAGNEIGMGAGRGATINVPFSPGAGDHWYGRAFRELLLPRAVQFQPDLILVSAGFDAHWIDPLAAAGLTLTGYAHLAREIVMMADELCEGHVLFLLEGGYHLEALAYGVLNVIYALTGRDEISDPLGPAPNPEQDMSEILGRLKQLHLLN